MSRVTRVLTAHLIARQVIDVQLLKAAQASDVNPTTLAVTLTRDGRMYLNEPSTICGLAFQTPRRGLCAEWISHSQRYAQQALRGVPQGRRAGGRRDGSWLRCRVSGREGHLCCCPILFVKAMGTAASLVFCVRQLGNIRIGSSPHINVPRGWG